MLNINQTGFLGFDINLFHIIGELILLFCIELVLSAFRKNSIELNGDKTKNKRLHVNLGKY